MHLHVLWPVVCPCTPLLIFNQTLETNFRLTQCNMNVFMHPVTPVASEEANFHGQLHGIHELYRTEKKPRINNVFTMATVVFCYWYSTDQNFETNFWLTQCNTNNWTYMYIVYSCILHVCQLYKLRLTPPMYYICLVSMVDAAPPEEEVMSVHNIRTPRDSLNTNWV